MIIKFSRILFLSLLCFAFSYCKTTEKALQNKSSENNQNLPDFFNYVPKAEEPFRATIHSNYDGVMASFDNEYRYGWTVFFLISKEGAKEWYDRQMKTIPDSVALSEFSKIYVFMNDIESKTYRELSKEMDIYVFNIAMEYLDFTTPDDPSAISPRKERIYKLDYETNTIILIEEFEMESDEGHSAWKWLDEFYNQIN